MSDFLDYLTGLASDDTQRERKELLEKAAR